MRIDRKELLKALAIAGKVVAKNGHMPILGCVLIDGKGMKATDLEVGVEIPLDIAPQEEGEEEVFCIGHADLSKIVKSMESDSETVTISPKTEGEDSETGNWVQIQDYWDLATLPADEYPVFETPKTSKDHWVTVGATALKNVLLASCKGDEVKSLDHAMFDAESQKVVATDGHRLHMAPAKIEGVSWAINDHFAKIILGLLGKDEDEVTFKTSVVKIVEEGNSPDFTGKKKPDLVAMAEELKVEVPEKATVAQIKDAITESTKDDGKLVVKNTVVSLENGTSFVCRVDGDIRFPDYKAVIPTEVKHSVVIRPKDVEKPLQQAMAIISENYRSVKLTFNGGIDVENSNPDKGNYQRETIPVVSGKVEPALEMGLNPDLLRDVLSTAPKDTTEITVELVSADKPLVFKHGKFLGLVMPMRV